MVVDGNSGKPGFPGGNLNAINSIVKGTGATSCQISNHATSYCHFVVTFDTAHFLSDAFNVPSLVIYSYHIAPVLRPLVHFRYIDCDHSS